LNKISGLKVPARTSSFAYKGRNTDIKQIARDLSVGTIVTGSVRTADKRLRISAQLINVSDNSQIWGDTYDEISTDLFALQDKLATAIAKALQQSLGGAAAASVAQSPPTRDVVAYQLFLQANSLMERMTLPNLKRAIELYGQAIDRDSNFARAYAGIATVHGTRLMVWSGSGHLETAERMAQKALVLDPGDSGALNVLAFANGFRGDYVRAAEYSLAALGNAENDATLHASVSGGWGSYGKIRDALAEARKAYALAPASPFVVGELASILSLAGNDAEAGKYDRLAADLGDSADSSGIQANSALRLGKFGEASVQRLKLYDTGDPEQARAAQLIKLVYAALADSSQRAVALAARNRLYPKRDKYSITNTFSAVESCTGAAYSYVLLGAIDTAYDLGNQCLDFGRPYGGVATYPLWSPELRPFRSDPRFRAYVTRMGLMPYWQKYGPPDDCDLNDNKLTCH
jgi:Flp pilus assembly protein TadD